MIKSLHLNDGLSPSIYSSNADMKALSCSAALCIAWKILIIRADNKIEGDYLVRKIWNRNFIFRALLSIKFGYGREPG